MGNDHAKFWYIINIICQIIFIVVSLFFVPLFWRIKHTKSTIIHKQKVNFISIFRLISFLINFFQYINNILPIDVSWF